MRTPQYAQDVSRGRRFNAFCRKCRKSRWFEIPEGEEPRNFSKTQTAIAGNCLICGKRELHLTTKDPEDFEAADPA